MKLKTNMMVFLFVIIVFGSFRAAAEEIVDRIVAIVDTDIITQIQLDRSLAPYLEQIESAGYTEAQKAQAVKTITQKVLDTLIEGSLTRQEADRYNITVSDEQVDDAIERVKKSKGLSDEAFNAALENEGYSFEEYRENIRKQILRVLLVNHAVKSKVIITKAEVEKYYNEKKDEYAGVKKYHLRNILMEDKAQMDKIIQLLDENKDFAELAKQYSTAPNASDGGELGLFELGSFPESIKDSVSKLSKGEHTDVISTARGVQIFYLQDIVMDGGKTLEQAYDEIHGLLYDQEVEQKFGTWLKALKEKAHIKIMI